MKISTLNSVAVALLMSAIAVPAMAENGYPQQQMQQQIPHQQQAQQQWMPNNGGNGFMPNWGQNNSNGNSNGFMPNWGNNKGNGSNFMPNFGNNNSGNNGNGFMPNMNGNTRDMIPSNGWNSGDMMDNMPWGGQNGGWGDTPPWGDWSNGNYPWGNDHFGKTPPWGNRTAWPENYPTGWGNGMPLTNPMNNGGQWAHPQFRPWSTGPFAGQMWNQNHPMNNTPMGRFPNWGNNFFGDYGPGTWKGITPWGNDVPFRWIDPNDPKGMVEVMWDDAINTPSDMGRMPPGWTAPSISVPNPIEVGEEFERNARKFPQEMRKMN